MTKVSFTRTENDLIKFSQVAHRPFVKGRLAFIVGAVVLALVVSESVLPLLRDTALWEMGSAIQTLSVLIVYLAAFLLFFKVFQRFAKQAWVEERGHFVTPKTVTLSKKGIRETSDHITTDCGWQAVLRVRREGGYIMAFIDKIQAFVVPDSAFENEAAAEAFYQQMLDYWKAANPEAAKAETADD